MISIIIPIGPNNPFLPDCLEAIKRSLYRDLEIILVFDGWKDNYQKHNEGNFSLKIIFCIGETLLQRKKKETHKILKNQISKGLRGVKKLNKVLFAYEPVWSIGSGLIPNNEDLLKTVLFIKSKLYCQHIISTES